MSRFDEISVGDSADIEHVITAEDIARFVELTGDDNRLHVDPVYAAQTTFKKPVAHGMLGASFISAVIGTKLPGDGALWFAQSLEFMLPARVGDKLLVRVVVLRKIDRMQTIELQTDIFNQHRQKVTTGVAKVKLVEKEASSDPEPRPERRVALVIGGSGGIGSAICHTLAKDGFEVAVHYYHNADGAARLVDEIAKGGGNAMAIGADLSSETVVGEMITRVVRHFGAITVLVNCATARIAATSFSDLVWDDLEEHLSVTIRGAFNLVRSVLSTMEKQKFGKLIFIGSQVSDAPVEKLLPYITAKAALVGFCRALAVDLGPKGIRVNIVSPSMINTDLITHVPERERLLVAARTPLRRLGSPEDVAGAVAFLASDRANFLNGETIRVNGGQLML